MPYELRFSCTAFPFPSAVPGPWSNTGHCFAAVSQCLLLSLAAAMADLPSIRPRLALLVSSPSPNITVSTACLRIVAVPWFLSVAVGQPETSLQAAGQLRSLLRRVHNAVPGLQRCRLPSPPLQVVLYRASPCTGSPGAFRFRGGSTARPGRGYGGICPSTWQRCARQGCGRQRGLDEVEEQRKQEV